MMCLEIQVVYVDVEYTQEVQADQTFHRKSRESFNVDQPKDQQLCLVDWYFFLGTPPKINMEPGKDGFQ